MRWRDATGKQHSRQFRTKRDAEDHAVRMTGPAARTPPPSPGRRRAATDEYFAAWLTNRKVRGRMLTPRTVEEYQRNWARHIAPTFGAVALGEISRADVDTWHTGLLADTTPAVAARCYRILHAVLASAVDEDRIAVNPARIRGAGQDPRTQRPTVEADQVARLLAATEPRYRAAVALAGLAGLRHGELLGLNRGDVDLERGIVTVRRQTQRVRSTSETATTKTAVLLRGPKSAASQRTVPLDTNLIALLRDHVDAGYSGSTDGEPVPARRARRPAHRGDVPQGVGSGP